MRQNVLIVLSQRETIKMINDLIKVNIPDRSYYFYLILRCIYSVSSPFTWINSLKYSRYFLTELTGQVSPDGEESWSWTEGWSFLESLTEKYMYCILLRINNNSQSALSLWISLRNVCWRQSRGRRPPTERPSCGCWSRQLPGARLSGLPQAKPRAEALPCM